MARINSTRKKKPDASSITHHGKLSLLRRKLKLKPEKKVQNSSGKRNEEIMKEEEEHANEHVGVNHVSKLQVIYSTFLQRPD